MGVEWWEKNDKVRWDTEWKLSPEELDKISREIKDKADKLIKTHEQYEKLHDKEAADADTKLDQSLNTNENQELPTNYERKDTKEVDVLTDIQQTLEKIWVKPDKIKQVSYVFKRRLWDKDPQLINNIIKTHDQFVNEAINSKDKLPNGLKRLWWAISYLVSDEDKILKK